MVQTTATDNNAMQMLIDLPGSGPEPAPHAIPANTMPEVIYKYPKNGLSGLL